MITVIEPNNSAEFPKLMEEMFQLRARVFRDRLGWNVQVADGKERDKYDDEAPVYVIYADDEAREVKGCLRLLPTTGPTVLTDFFQIRFQKPCISMHHRSGSALGSALAIGY